MAQFYTSAVTGYGVTVRGLCTYTESDVSTTNNTSKLTVGLKAHAPDGWRSIRYAKMTVTVNGSVVSTQTLSSAIEEGWDGTVIFADKALTVTHNNNGEATVNISVEIGFGTTSANSTGSANFSLTTIARASTLTTIASSITLASTSGNNNIAKIVSKGNFYHKLQYSFNNSSWTNLVDKLQVNNTTSAWQVLARTTLLAGYPSDASGTLYLRVYTYSDSAESTQVGSVQTASIAIAIDTSAIKPSITVSTAITVNSSPISGYLIAGHSSAKAGFTTTKSSGAASVTTYYSIPSGYVGTLVTTSSTSTSAVNVATNTLPSNTSATSKKVKIQAYAVDSRGAVSATATTGELTVYPYNPPKITGNFFRCVSTSSKTADEAGAAATGTFSGTLGANASVNSKNSIASTTCKYSKNGGTATNFTSGGTVAIAESDVIVFTVTATDKVTSSTSTFTVPAALFPIDLYQNGSDMGVGLGRVAVQNKILAAKSVYVGATKSAATDGEIGVVLSASDGTVHLTSSGAAAVYFHGGSTTKTSGGVLSNTNGATYLREYCKNADSSELTDVYENYWLPASTPGRASNARYEILTTKGTEPGGAAVLPVSNGGTGAQSLDSITVGISKLAYRLESALAGKSGTTTTNRWYKIGTCTITGANTDITTVIVVSCPYGSLAHGGAQWGIARLKLRSGASGKGMISASCAIEWLASNNLAPANFKLLVDTASTDNSRVNELWVYAAGSYQTWTVTKLTESNRSAVQENNAQGWKFTNKYAAEGASAVTSGLTEVTPTFALSNGRVLYNDATGTNGTVTLAETAADFHYLDIYFYTSHGSGSTPKRMGHQRVYSPNDNYVALTNVVYWSNELLFSQSQIHISGTSITRLSNEQAQFKLTTSAASRTATTTNIYIYRVDGYR